MRQKRLVIGGEPVARARKVPVIDRVAGGGGVPACVNVLIDAKALPPELHHLIGR